MYLKNSVLYLIIILVWLKKVPNMLSAKNFQFFNGQILLLTKSHLWMVVMARSENRIMFPRLTKTGTML